MAEPGPVPLARKLGIKPGARVLLAGELDGFELGPLPDDVTVSRRARANTQYDVIVVLCPDAATMLARVPALVAALPAAGGLWIGWPKQASGRPTDLGDAAVRDYGLGTGLVDNKVAALSAIWSGLRFVHRATNRAGLTNRA